MRKEERGEKEWRNLAGRTDLHACLHRLGFCWESGSAPSKPFVPQSGEVGGTGIADKCSSSRVGVASAGRPSSSQGCFANQSGLSKSLFPTKMSTKIWQGAMRGSGAMVGRKADFHRVGGPGVSGQGQRGALGFTN